MLISCPSGLQFNARKWKLKDRRTLTDKRILRSNSLLPEMLKLVDEGCVNSGPYDVKPGQKVPWQTVALQDIMAALVQVREATQSTMAFTTQCENPRCTSDELPVDADLSTVECKPMSQAAVTHLRTNEPIPVKLTSPITATLYMKLLRGEDMKKLAQYYNQDVFDGIDAGRLMHVARIEFTDGTTLDRFDTIWDWYQDQDFEFADGLAGAIEQCAGGVDTNVEVTCEECGREQITAIPFGPEFFIPQKSKSKPSTGLI